MTTATSSLHRLAREVFDREFHRREALVGHAGARCPASWLLDEMVALLEQAHESPADELEPTIRERICSIRFQFEGGDACDIASDEEVTAYVRLLTDVLESVRKLGLQRGHFSELPATPPMFG